MENKKINPNVEESLPNNPAAVDPKITITQDHEKVTESEKGPQKSMDEVDLPVPQSDINRVQPTGQSEAEKRKARKNAVESDELVIPICEPVETKRCYGVNHIPPYEKGR